MYISKFELPSMIDEDRLLYSEQGLGYMKCYRGNLYPFGIFTERGEKNRGVQIEFMTPITILYGGNGSGKTTILNLIAESINASRHSTFNKSGLFYNYLEWCNVELYRRCEKSLMITSDDVFEHLIKERRKFDVFNENRDNYRNTVTRERELYKKERVSIDFDDPYSIDAFKRKMNVLRKSNSSLIVENLGVDRKGQSNGETSMDFFTDQIQNRGLYMIDEPENSLSPKMQVALSEYLSIMANEVGCQFIIATHSPFFISMDGATVYNLDSEIIAPCDWTQLESIMVYRDFFRKLEASFSESDYAALLTDKQK